MSKKFNCIFFNCTTCPVLTGLYILLCTSFSHSQGTWTQKASVFTTTARAGVFGFSIGGKGYMGAGWQYNIPIYYNDFWEWDQGTNAWTQKANFAGSARGDAVSFSIGNKGYALTGYDGAYATNELWEWDQAANTWSQKAIFPGLMRAYGAGFSIGLKGYVGCGINGGVLNDFWEYDQLTDTWLQKADIPVARFICVSFSIGNMGYVCIGGFSNSNLFNDMWEFNPALNTWTQKANFPGGIRAFASGFSIGNMGYVGTGWDGGTTYNDFWRFDPALNSWAPEANYPHLITDIDDASFSIGCKGYFGTGATTPNSGAPYFSDFWEYEPDTCSLTGIEIPFASGGSEFLISPNPFSEKLNIRIDNNEPAEIIIYDMNSKKVFHKNFTNTVSINTRSFAKGIYIYEVKNKNGYLKREKIVKN